MRIDSLWWYKKVSVSKSCQSIVWTPLEPVTAHIPVKRLNIGSPSLSATKQLIPYILSINIRSTCN